MNDSIPRIRHQYEQHCTALKVPLVFRTNPADDGSAHVEYIGGAYHYVATERGLETERRVASSEDEILYWLLSDVVFTVACAFEVKNRVKGQDFRRLLFSKELQLMRSLNPEWARWKQAEINNILVEAPFDDVIEIKTVEQTEKIHALLRNKTIHWLIGFLLTVLGIGKLRHWW